MADEVPNPLYPLVDRLSKEAQEILRPLIAEIMRRLQAGETPEVAVQGAFTALGIKPAIQEAIASAFVQAAAIGYGIPVAQIGNPLAIKRAALEMTWPGDAINFSRRIIDPEFKADVAATLRAHLRRGDSFMAAAEGLSDPLRLGGGPNLVRGEVAEYVDRLVQEARAVMGAPMPPTRAAFRSFNARLAAMERQVARLAGHGAPTRALRAAYEDVVAAARSLNTAALEEAVRVAAVEKARYHAERIARTEIARAYGYSFDLRNIADPDTMGVRFRLSTRHPYPCICNVHTGADLFGMGPGAYPKAFAPPYPFHPHCLCLKEEVWKGEVEEGGMDAGGIPRLLASMPRAHQARLLTIKGAAEFREDPNTWRKNLRQYKDPEEFKKNLLNASHFRG